jgi:hypothetical protein
LPRFVLMVPHMRLQVVSMPALRRTLPRTPGALRPRRTHASAALLHPPCPSCAGG